MYTVLSVFKESLLYVSHVDILCRVSFILVSTSFQVFADVTTAVLSAYETIESSGISSKNSSGPSIVP